MFDLFACLLPGKDLPSVHPTSCSMAASNLQRQAGIVNKWKEILHEDIIAKSCDKKYTCTEANNVTFCSLLKCDREGAL